MKCIAPQKNEKRVLPASCLLPPVLRTRRGQRGSVGLSAIAALVIILILILAMVAISRAVLTSGSHTSRLRALRNVAESGIQYGYWQYNYNAAILPYTLTRNFGPGQFAVTITDNSALLSSSIKVVSTASVRNDTLTLTRVFASSGYPNYPLGFLLATGMTLNGIAKYNLARLQLTQLGGSNNLGTAFFTRQINIASFHTTFTFQLSGAVGNGITFTIQNVGANEIPAFSGGGGLGYGPDNHSGAPGIPNSVCIKFDTHDNEGEGTDSTGLYTNGAPPTTPATDLTGTGITLSNFHIFRVDMAYDGHHLSVMITDTLTSTVARQIYTIDIPGTIGNTVGYVGFTGASGASTANQEIASWTFGP